MFKWLIDALRLAALCALVLLLIAEVFAVAPREALVACRVALRELAGLP